MALDAHGVFGVVVGRTRGLALFRVLILQEVRRRARHTLHRRPHTLRALRLTPHTLRIIRIVVNRRRGTRAITQTVREQIQPTLTTRTMCGVETGLALTLAGETLLERGFGVGSLGAVGVAEGG